MQISSLAQLRAFELILAWFRNFLHFLEPNKSQTRIIICQKSSFLSTVEGSGVLCNPQAGMISSENIRMCAGLEKQKSK